MLCEIMIRQRGKKKKARRIWPACAAHGYLSNPAVHVHGYLSNPAVHVHGYLSNPAVHVHGYLSNPAVHVHGYLSNPAVHVHGYLSNPAVHVRDDTSALRVGRRGGNVEKREHSLITLHATGEIETPIPKPPGHPPYPQLLVTAHQNCQN